MLVSAAADLLKVDCVGVLLLDEAGRVRTVAASGPAAAALEAAQEQWQCGPGVDVLATGQVLAVVDLATAPEYRRLWPQLADAGVRGVLAAPVVVRNEVVGNLNAVTGQRQHWSDADRRGAQALAGLIGELLRTATAGSTSGHGGPPERDTGEPGL